MGQTIERAIFFFRHALFQLYYSAPMQEVVPSAAAAAVRIEAIRLMMNFHVSFLFIILGFKVYTAESGEEALDLLDKNVYDILFFDHMMPGMDGVELFHELKKHSENPNSKIPAIVLTANAIKGAKEEYIQEGFDSYLSKPVDISTLDNIIIKYLPKEKILM